MAEKVGSLRADFIVDIADAQVNLNTIEKDVKSTVDRTNELLKQLGKDSDTPALRRILGRLKSGTMTADDYNFLRELQKDVTQQIKSGAPNAERLQTISSIISGAKSGFMEFAPRPEREKVDRQDYLGRTEQQVIRLMTRIRELDKYQLRGLRLQFEELKHAGVNVDRQLKVIDRTLGLLNQPELNSLGNVRTGKGSNPRAFRYATQNLAYGFEDALVSYQLGGMKAAARAAGNNVSAIAATMIPNPGYAAAAIAGTALVTAGIGYAADKYGDQKKFEENEKRFEAGLMRIQALAEKKVDVLENLGLGNLAGIEKDLDSVKKKLEVLKESRTQVASEEQKINNLLPKLSTGAFGVDWSGRYKSYEGQRDAASAKKMSLDEEIKTLEAERELINKYSSPLYKSVFSNMALGNKASQQMSDYRHRSGYDMTKTEFDAMMMQMREKSEDVTKAMFHNEFDRSTNTWRTVQDYQSKHWTGKEMQEFYRTPKDIRENTHKSNLKAFDSMEKQFEIDNKNRVNDLLKTVDDANRNPLEKLQEKYKQLNKLFDSATPSEKFANIDKFTQMQVDELRGLVQDRKPTEKPVLAASDPLSREDAAQKQKFMSMSYTSIFDTRMKEQIEVSKKALSQLEAIKKNTGIKPKVAIIK